MEPVADPLSDSVNHLLSTMLCAREILHSLRLLTRLLNQLVNYDASSEGCGPALMRMRHCALCSGHLLAYPCPALCVATLDFCLRPLLALKDLWEGIFGLIELEIAQWIESPRGTLYWSVSQLPGHVNFVARMIIAAFSDKFPKECPLYEDSRCQAQDLTLRLRSWVRHADAVFRGRLTGRPHDIEDILLKVQTIKRLWADASLAICHESPYLFSSMATEDTCWNGTAIGPFKVEKCAFCGSPFKQRHYSQVTAPRSLLRSTFPWKVPEESYEENYALLDGIRNRLRQATCRFKQGLSSLREENAERGRTNKNREVMFYFL
ncbi:hypothetical protein SprV_0702431600 [Sparganum proliferum]